MKEVFGQRVQAVSRFSHLNSMMTSETFGLIFCMTGLSEGNSWSPNEADESHIGGKQSFENMREFGQNKTPFFIAVQEWKSGSPRFVSLQELDSIYEQHVLPAIEKKIAAGSTIKSDGAGRYTKAADSGYTVEQVVAQKTPDLAHEHLKWVNTLTSNLKRFLLSTYHGVYPKYRKAYLAEFAYRFNRRYWPYESFDRLLYDCVNSKIITLPELRA